MKQSIASPLAPKPVGPYSAALRAGQLLFVSGQVPLDPATGRMVEGDIAVSRQVYNDTVLTYDTALETVPTSIIAGIFNFRAREYFEVEEAAIREAPQVSFP